MPIYNKNLGLNGLDPLSYMGVNPEVPVPFYKKGRAPTTTDWQNFIIGTIWLDTSTENVWMLVSLNANIATWVMFSSGSTGAVLELTSNTGGAVPPTAGNINVVGDGTTITGVGNPGTSTITLTAPANTNTSIVTVTTADATPTTIFTHTLATSSAIVVEGWIIGARSDYTGALSGSFNGGARNPAGTAILLGTPFIEYSTDSAGLPTIDITVSTTHINVVVTGVAAQTWNWKAFINYQVLP